MGEADFVKVDSLRPDTHGLNLKVKVGSSKSQKRFSYSAIADFTSMQHCMHVYCHKALEAFDAYSSYKCLSRVCITNHKTGIARMIDRGH